MAYDVNGDGAVDIICSFDPTFTGNYELVWFENPRGQGGNPITDTWTMHIIGPPEGADENNLSMGDIDGDGKIDIISPEFILLPEQPGFVDPGAIQHIVPRRCSAGYRLRPGAINLVGTQPAVSAQCGVVREPARDRGQRAHRHLDHAHHRARLPLHPRDCPPAAGIEPAAYNTLDVNGDGRMDVISSQSEGPGPIDLSPPPGGLYWWEAPADRRNGTWIKHLMDYNMIDVHKIDLADMDKNGTTRHCRRRAGPIVPGPRGCVLQRWQG